MHIPKPQPPKKPMTPPLNDSHETTPVASPSEEAVKIGVEISNAKREFVLKPHLTQRPFRTPDMAELRKTLEVER